MEVYLKPCGTLTRNIQNPAIGHYSNIFRHIQNLAQHLHMQNLAYSESWNIQNLLINASRQIFRILSYKRKFANIQYSDIFKTRHSLSLLQEFFAKIFKNYNYFSKALHLRSLTEFWIRLSLNKYSIICTVTSPALSIVWYIFRTQSIIVSSDIFRHIQVVLRRFQPYIVAYLQPYVTLTYSESCQGIFQHIQNAV